MPTHLRIKYIELNLFLKPGNTPRQPVSLLNLRLFICLVSRLNYVRVCTDVAFLKDLSLPEIFP